MTDFRPAAIVPTYNNARTVRGVVESLRGSVPDVIVVDDGSGPETQEVVAGLEQSHLARTVRRDVNGGKGAAVKTGMAIARELGFTHALQVDADGQHDLGDVPQFLETARRNPKALVLGRPIFERSAPLGRLLGRQITVFWTRLETGGRRIADPMCGFRVYPLEAGEWSRCGDRMDFDIEVAVRLAWRGTPIINLPTRVRYLTEGEGGLSSFRLFEDNLRISWLHTRLVFGALARLLGWPLRALAR
ncbi:MAG: glycosyltransferase family 2 protein [Myxococcales bacterium]